MTIGHFPFTRMRRMRMTSFARDLRREHQLTTHDLIQPLFVKEGDGKPEPVASMPGVFRYSVKQLIEVATETYQLGIPAVALFPLISGSHKSRDGKAAWNDKGLVPVAVRAIKRKLPDLGVITDVALDPYTTHGQDGLINDDGDIANDLTTEALAKQALCHAKAGADVVAPSDMMDGRIGVIRKNLESQGFHNTLILAYSAKYASSFYSPFRDAVGSKAALGKATKHTYQMDPANSDEALQEIALDLDEGADMIMIKPGLAYLDIIRRARERFHAPILAYNVSGEYAMIKAAAERGWLNEKDVTLETLLAFKRAGAHGILTYHALDVARWLK
jgi:porphobilinogen synthase